MKQILFITFLVAISMAAVAQPSGLSPTTATEDTLTIEQKIITNPDELRKLGVDESVIQELNQIKSTMSDDSLRLNQQLAKDPELRNYDTIIHYTSELERKKRMIIEKALALPPPMVYGHGFFRKGLLEVNRNALNARAPSNYLIGIGDELNISIWGNSYHNQTYRVGSNGAIEAQYVGKINLQGLTFEDAKKQIRSRFGRYYNLAGSNMEITLNYSRVISVNIVGEVLNPGTYTFPARNSAFNALISINGPNQIGSVRNIQIKRDGKVIRTLDVYKYLQNPGQDQDFFLEDNDYIIVGSLGKVVTIDGEIKRPDNYELLDNEDLDELVKYSGGLKPTAYTKVIQVKRFQDNRELVIDVNYDEMKKMGMRFALKDGDVVTIATIPEGLKNFITIRGQVNVPGVYEMSDSATLLDLINKANGVTEDAYLGRAYLVREKDDLTKKYLTINLESLLSGENPEDNIILRKYDEVNILSQRTFIEVDSIAVFGSVKEPGAFLYAEGMTLADALFLSGGFRPEAANNIIEVSRLIIEEGKATEVRILSEKLERDLSLSPEAKSFELEPFDQVFVRAVPEYEDQRNVFIGGEVKYPGLYTLRSNYERISDLIERAGGVNNGAFIEGATLYRSKDSLGVVILDLDEVLRKTNSRFNYLLAEGDSIFIPKELDFVTINGGILYPNFNSDSIREVAAPFIKGKRAKFYIQNYGAGFSKNAKRAQTIVKQPGGKVDRTINLGIFKIFPKVKSGATVIVEEDPTKKKKKSEEQATWQDRFQDFLTATTSLLTLVLLYKTATN